MVDKVRRRVVVYRHTMEVVMIKRSMFIADALWERLRKVAERDGCGISELVRRAIVEWLGRNEG